MTDFHTLERPEYFAQQYEELQLTPPIIRVSDRLDLRMLRRGRVMEVNEGALLAGISDLEVESPTQIDLDTVDKKDDSIKPEVSLPYGWETHALYRSSQRYESGITVKLNPNMDAEKLAAGAEQKLNTAFWLGVLVTEKLAEGKAREYESEKQKQGRMPLREHLAVPVGGIAVNETLLFATHLGPYSIAIGMSLQIGTAIALARRRSQIRNMDLGTFILNKNTSEAEGLAAEYPVLSQGYKDPFESPALP